MKIIEWKEPIVIGFIYYFLMKADHSGIFDIGLLAAMLHEAGHAVVWILFTGKLPKIEIKAKGLCLMRQGMLFSAENELLLAMAGPAANLAAAIVALILQEWKATFRRYYFIWANILLAVFNLLPISHFDGRYLWEFLREKLQSFRK